ncbi:uncharacterized protein CANTADRAFT_87337 [Suhomyces tanzawaensis NRRL Y-17324]|uniref:Uncharacterized protein n=1 Tax=Suhomyces tanzawaensis NRRL Y-17324 TaxID=984487 RepID=A0A1E4SPH7_9ASCO|nr:uncharacterized protein CANTADRAFT_87337 [Suhomyces tanzawaensis NRRL Y-17324]ODV81327.1 hypothetical protein CANTADRAFT_87337 [Suhomyces tanzawaensis NRRL Y-17324]
MNDPSLYDTFSQATSHTSYSQDTQTSNPLVRFWSSTTTGAGLASGPEFLSGDPQDVMKPFHSQSKGQLNINAPSYIPAYAKEPVFPDVPASRLQAAEQECQELKVEMILKNQMIKNLTEQLSVMDHARSQQIKELSYPPIVGMDQSIRIPHNHYQLFQDLSKTLQEKISELEDTREKLETLIVSISMGTSGVRFTQDGHYDEQELTHKIVSKLQLLKAENDNLLHMFSYGTTTSLMVELGLLRNENKTLVERLRQQELQRQDTRNQE